MAVFTRTFAFSILPADLAVAKVVAENIGDGENTFDDLSKYNTSGSKDDPVEKYAKEITVYPETYKRVMDELDSVEIASLQIFRNIEEATDGLLPMY